MNKRTLELINIGLLISFVLTACNTGSGSVISTEKPVASATIEKPTITVEPTKTPTETPEPTPTPEIYTGNPNNIDSWPEKFKNYYVNNPEDQSMDEEFQKFMDKIRMDYLKEKGVEGLEKMDKDEIFFNYLKHTAIDKQKCILTITEIMNIIGDPDIASLEFNLLRTGEPKMYGIWYNVTDKDTLQYLRDQTHTTSIYGRELLLHRGSYQGMTTGDFVGVVDLPGTKENYALLLRIRDLNNRNHYVIRRVLGEKMENLEYLTMETVGKRDNWYELITDIDRLVRERIVWPPIYVNIQSQYELTTRDARAKFGNNLYFFDESGIEAAGNLYIPVIKENPNSGEY